MNTKLAQLMRAMINYDGGDVPRIQHFVKVHNFAATIEWHCHIQRQSVSLCLCHRCAQQNVG